MLWARARRGRYMTSYLMSKRLSRRSRAIVAIFWAIELLLEQLLVVGQVVAEEPDDSVAEARPRMSWARPFDTASSVENSWLSRTGSFVLSTVTEVPSRMRSVAVAIAASSTGVAESVKPSR